VVSGFRAGVLLVGAALTLAVGCSGDDDDRAAPPTEAPTSPPATSLPVPSSTSPPVTTEAVDREWHTPTLADEPCPAGYPANARCATFTVAADRLDSGSGTVALPVVVLAATGADPVPDALVIPAGGPGYPGADDLDWAGTPWNERRDIVLYDQRGTGGAAPSLECPGVDAAFVAALQADDDDATERDAITAARATCLDELEAAGIDLSDYHSEANAADLDELRQALGYKQWNVLGVSYGARLALATMRAYPDGVRAAILDSVYDVTSGGLAATLSNVEQAIDRLVEGCAADATCAAAHGDLGAKIEQTRQRYNAEPAAVEADIGKGPQQFVITGDDLMAGLFNALYDTALIPLLPAAIDDLLSGDTQLIPPLIERGVPFAIGFADGMATAVNCADNAGLDTAAADARAFDEPRGLGLVLAQIGLCTEWPPTPGDFNAPVSSAIPSLVLAGSYDPITSSEVSEAAAGRLSNSTFILVDPVGHGATGYSDCITNIELAFLDDPTAALDLRCVAAIPGPAFS
jgi:pimeloyl-ACP methyl ester carboxylesterase